MTKINLEDDGVFYVEITVEEARAFECNNEKLFQEMDEAQARPFSGDGPSYLVIKIG